MSHFYPLLHLVSSFAFLPFIVNIPPEAKSEQRQRNCKNYKNPDIRTHYKPLAVLIKVKDLHTKDRLQNISAHASYTISSITSGRSSYRYKGCREIDQREDSNEFDGGVVINGLTRNVQHGSIQIQHEFVEFVGSGLIVEIDSLVL